MSHPRLTGEEITRQGKAIYQAKLRAQVETLEHIGKFISIDVETEDFEVGDNLLIAIKGLQARRPEAAIWSERIGFNAVYAVGGTLVRTL